MKRFHRKRANWAFGFKLRQLGLRLVKFEAGSAAAAEPTDSQTDKSGARAVRPRMKYKNQGNALQSGRGKCASYGLESRLLFIVKV